MENNKFDKQFEFMRDMEEHAPMHLWPKVLQEIQPKRKRKTRFLFFSLLGLGFLAMVTLVGNSFLKVKSADAVAKSVLVEKQVVHTQQELRPGAPEKNNFEKEITNNTQPSIKKTIKNTNIVASPNDVQISVVDIVSTPSVSEVSIPEVPFTEKGFVSEVIAEEESIDFAQLSEVNIKNNEGPQSKQESVLSKEAMKEIPSNEVIEKELILAEKEKPLADPEKKCEGSRVISVPSSIFVDAYVSPVFGNTFFSANTTEGRSYARLRDSTERSGVGIMTGVRLGYIHSSGLNIRAGIAYQQIKTTFKHSVEEDEKMIVTTVRDDSGNIIGRDTTFEFGRRDLKIANHYKTVDIPISIGYISMKNQVQLGFHAGTVLNLNFTQNGTYLNEAGHLTAFKDSKMYNKNIGLSFFGSVELQYLLGEQWGLFLEPQVRFYPKSLTVSSHPLKQNVTTFNVLTGIKYIF